MDTFAPWSDTAFAPAKPYEPGETNSFLDQLAANANRTLVPFVAGQAVRARNIGDFLAASDRQHKLAGYIGSRQAALEDGYERLIGQVRDATGVTLKNPVLFDDPETRGLAEQARRRSLSGLPDAGALQDFLDRRQAAFLEQARSLKAQNPEALATLDLDTPIAAQVARNVQGAVAEAAAAADRLSTPDWLAATVAGGLWSGRRDPLFWMSLGLPAAGVGATAVARIATAAAKQGLGMAGVTAVAQPEVQAWRKDVGLPNGPVEAAKEIALSGVLGAGLGGGIHAVGPLVKALQRRGVHVDAPTEQALAAAHAADSASAATLTSPDTVPAPRASETLLDGLARADDPAAPLPLVDRPVAPGTTDAAAREGLAKAQSLPEAIDWLKGDEIGIGEQASLERPVEPRPSVPDEGAVSPDEFWSRIASALASPDPQIRDAGRLATLGDQALAPVLSGEVDPTLGAIVAATTHDEAKQAAMIADLQAARPTTVDEARQVLSDRVAADNARASAVARVGQAAADRDLPVVTRPPRPETGVRDMVPIVRDDGAVELRPRGDLADVAAKERNVLDVIAACRG